MRAGRREGVRDLDSAIYVGVDAGGSHSEAVVTDHTLEVLARERGPAGAIATDRIDLPADAIVRTVQRAVERAHRNTGPRVLVVGAAGGGQAEVRARLREALERARIAHAVTVTTDAAIAYRSVFGDGSGMLLIAGSGSIAVGCDGGGTEWRAGGLGWQRGDEGSGYAIGRAALKAVEMAAEERGPARALVASLTSATETGSRTALLTWANTAQPAQVASLARAVQAAAGEGDELAGGIVQDAAAALAYLVSQLLLHYPADAPVRLALWGGVLSPGSPVRRRLTETLGTLAQRVTLTDAVPDPALGAATLAVTMARGNGTD